MGPLHCRIYHLDTRSPQLAKSKKNANMRDVYIGLLGSTILKHTHTHHTGVAAKPEAHSGRAANPTAGSHPCSPRQAAAAAFPRESRSGYWSVKSQRPDKLLQKGLCDDAYKNSTVWLPGPDSCTWDVGLRGTLAF